MLEGKEVTCFPSYGAEMRGGTANSTVIVSDEMIGSPVVTNPDVLIVMNEESLKRFQTRIKTGGLMIFDSSLIPSTALLPDIHAIGVPASEIAASITESGPPRKDSSPSTASVRSANMVMFGVLIAETGILKEENAMRALETLTSAARKKTLEGNREAIRRGMHYREHTKSTNS
jgi:2-oxoglutarate ferredoxin oxidoreductase subunit gamma